MEHEAAWQLIDGHLAGYGFTRDDVGGEILEAVYGLITNSNSGNYHQGVLDMLINVCGAE